MNTPRHTLTVRHAVVVMAFAFSSLSAAAAPAISEAPASVEPATIEFLLASSAKDFIGSGGDRPTAIRRARIGFFSESGKGVYLLCGSFKTAGAQAKWTHFATLKTSDYEQWLGGTAKAYCEQRTIKWYPGEHSAALEQRLKD